LTDKAIDPVVRAAARLRDRPDPRAGGILTAALLTALLASAALSLPLLLPLASVAPFPLAVLRIRGGGAAAVLATMMATALLAAGFSPGLALAFFLTLAAPGLLIAEGVSRGRGLLRGCAWAFSLLTFEIGAALFFVAPRILDSGLASFDYLRSAGFLEGLRQSGLPPDQLEQWTERMEVLRRIWQTVYPAALIVSGGLLVFLNALLVRAYLARRDPGWLDGGEFEGIRWPFGLAVAFVAGGAMVASPPLRPAGYNVLLVAAFFLAIQGLAVVAFYAHRLAGPAFLRAAVLVLVLVNPWAPHILGLLGLFDIWFDFRARAAPR
jgi:uncharacterized protein YybS (DUF2232 family)